MNRCSNSYASDTTNLSSCALSNLLLQIGTLRHCGFAIDKRKKEESSLGAKCRTDRIELGQGLNSRTVMKGREVEEGDPDKRQLMDDLKVI